ncbi:hypothetical protein [Paraburkholderia xenovorans]|uniref:hypothetical protein n=1 Tax=Paraburkholderia xenovorans TaxID=36873 RepID=UPI0015C56033|nr:hypothetical protein [Paraburkholderia xenovorans]NPT39644.1 hypothetical protein [Paraburkholderia xenovorans]
MKVNATSHSFWPNVASNVQGNARPSQTRVAPARAGNDVDVDAEAGAVATEAVIGNDIAAEMERFNASLGMVDEDVERGRDTTHDMIAAASAYNQALQLGALATPPAGLQSKIDRLKTALRDSKGNESLGSAGQKANVDLSALTHQPDAASTYGKYGKAASTYTRALIFDEARFNNSAVLKNTPLAALQRPNRSVLDPLGLNGRLGILTGTRLNSAASYFAKGGLSFLSGMEKLHNGQDPTKDFITAGATTGQGINELTVGIGTDVGNHLVKLRQVKAAAQTAGKPDTGPGGSTAKAGQSQSGATPGTSEPVAGPSSATEFTDFDPHKDDAGVDALEQKTAGHIDDQLTQQQQSLREGVIARLANTNPDVQQLELQDATNDLAPQYFEMQDMAKQLKASTVDAANDAHENIKTIDAKAEGIIARLKSQGFDSADAARQSGKPEAIELGRQLDQLAGLKHAAYDQFNSAMQERENALADARTAFGDLGRLLENTPASERPSKLQEWSDKYTKFFAQRQANILSKTDSWPDWMKISKPLRMQMVPAAINTVLGGATFGVALDTYLKKQKAGTLTPQDKMDFAASVINLSSGLIGFVPVIGPALSFALATTGLVLGGMSDQYDARKRETDTYNLKEKIRGEYNAKHPDKEIAEAFDGD